MQLHIFSLFHKKGTAAYNTKKIAFCLKRVVVVVGGGGGGYGGGGGVG